MEVSVTLATSMKSPIERMNKGLGDWLSFRVPFAVKGDLKDEVLELKEKIESLIYISIQTKY